MALSGGAQASKVLYDSFGSASAGTLGGQFNNPRGVAVNTVGTGGASAGAVYVVDGSNNRVQQFSSAGTFVRAFGRDVIATGKPNDNGTGYEICDTTAGNVAADCKIGITTPAGGGTLSNPQGITVDQSTGNLYVTNQNLQRVEEFDATGHFVRAFGKDVLTGGVITTEVCAVAANCKTGVSGVLGGEFASPSGYPAVVPAGSPNAGNVIVPDPGNRRVQEFSSAGAFIRAWGYGVVSGGAEGTGTVTNGSPSVSTATTTKKAFVFGQTITGTGIAPGTTIINPVAAGALTLSQAATPAATGAGTVLTVAAGTGNVAKDEQQTITVAPAVTVGNFKLSFTAPNPQGPTNPAQVTANIPFNATAGEVQVALTALTNLGAGGVSVSLNPGGNPGGGAGPGGPWTVTFAGIRYADTNVSQLAVAEGSPGPLIGGAATVLTTTEGTAAFEICTAAADCAAGASSGSGIGQFANGGPSRVAVDSTGAIYTVEGGGSRVQKFTAAGPNLTSSLFNPTITLDPLFSLNGPGAPTDIAIGPLDSVFVTKSCGEPSVCPGAPNLERRIYEFSSAGQILGTYLAGVKLGVSTGTGTTDVNGLAVNPASGRLYVSSTTSGHRVYIAIDAPTQPPSSTTGAVEAGLNEYSRVLYGVVNPAGFKVTDCHFEYGPSAEYGASSKCIPSAASLGEGIADVAVSAVISPLEPNTVYHYRLFSSNAGKTGQGKDRTFTTGPAGADSCTNAGIRAEQGVEVRLLPECMALEQISPAKKGNQSARITLYPAVSPDGGRVLFNSTATLGNCPNSNIAGGDPILALRNSSGWNIECTTPPIGPQFTGRFIQQSFTPELSSWFQLMGTPEGRRYFKLGIGFEPQAVTPPMGAIGTSLEGATPDHSRIYMAAFFPSPLLPGDPTPSGFLSDNNAYTSALDSGGQPVMELLARDRDGKIWGGNCGARLGGMSHSGFNLPNGERNQGAISADGSRVYFSTRPGQPASGGCAEVNKERIMVREETPSGPKIEELITSECGRVSPVCSTTDGDDVYQGASVDQTRVYFTSTRQLTDDDLDESVFSSCSKFFAAIGCDLYLYDSTKPVGQRLTDVSAGESSAATPGIGAGVRNSITAISGDGSHVYFVAQTVLTTDPNPMGAVPQNGQPNLYLYRYPQKDLSFVGKLSEGDAGSLFAGEDNLTNWSYAVPIVGTDGNGKQIGGDGHVLVFNSRAQLSPDDDDSAIDLYRYDAVASTLDLVSAAGVGGSDDGSFDVIPRPGGATRVGGPGTDYAEQGRWASENGEAIVFTTREALLAGDENGGEDSYLWRAGQLFHLPGSSLSSAQARANEPIISHDGLTVAYHSTKRLTWSDIDSTEDAYVLREGGGFPAPIPPAICVDEACQGPPSVAPGDIGAASGAIFGPGNVKPGGSPCPKGKRKVKRGNRTRCVKSSKSKKQASRKRAGAKQGGQK